MKLGQRTGSTNQIQGFQPHEMFLNSNTGIPRKSVNLFLECQDKIFKINRSL